MSRSSPLESGGELAAGIGAGGFPRGARDFKLFIGLDLPHGHGTLRDNGFVRRIPIRVKLDAEEAETVAHPFADDGRVLADSSRKDERLDPPRRRGIRADRLLHRVTD